MFINILERYRDSDVGDIEKTKTFVQGFTWYDKTESKRYEGKGHLFDDGGDADHCIV
jgi:hypothetical protein